MFACILHCFSVNNFGNYCWWHGIYSAKRGLVEKRNLFMKTSIHYMSCSHATSFCLGGLCTGIVMSIQHKYFIAVYKEHFVSGELLQNGGVLFAVTAVLKLFTLLQRKWNEIFFILYCRVISFYKTFYVMFALWRLILFHFKLPRITLCHKMKSKQKKCTVNALLTTKQAWQFCKKYWESYLN